MREMKTEMQKIMGHFTTTVEVSPTLAKEWQRLLAAGYVEVAPGILRQPEARHA